MKRSTGKNVVGLLVLVLLLVLSPAAQAAFVGPYLEFQAGGHLPDTADLEGSQGVFNLEFDSTTVAGVAAGYELNPGWGVGVGRLELAYGYLSVSAAKARFVEGKVPATGDLTVQTLLFNIWGSGRGGAGLTPYLGGGLGAGWVKADQLQVSGQPLSDDEAFCLAYQLGLGVDYAVTDHLWLDLGYRFQGLDRLEFAAAGGGQLKTNLHGHSLILGLRLGF